MIMFPKNFSFFSIRSFALQLIRCYCIAGFYFGLEYQLYDFCTNTNSLHIFGVHGKERTFRGFWFLFPPNKKSSGWAH